MPIEPLALGRTYSWPDVEVRLLGNLRPIAGISEISWKEDNENQHNHGAGREAVSYSYGKSSYSGSMKLSLDEVQAIKNSLGVSSLGKLAPFDIIVSHNAGLKILTETLVGVLVNGEDHTASSGGAVLEVTISFTFANYVSK